MESHEYANLFPMMADADLKELAADIKKHGLREAVVMLDGKILDGRNRFRACELAGVKPHSVAYEGSDALGYVLSHNLHRRHLTESQRAMVAAKWAQLKVGSDGFQGNQYKSGGPPIGGPPKSETKTRNEAAKLLSVGTGSVDRAKRVVANAIPEVKELVEAGKLSVNAAFVVSKLPEEEQAAAASGGAAGVKEAAKAAVAAQRQEEAPEPEPVVVDGTRSSRLPKWVPDDAERLWLLAKTDLDKILKTDLSRERILKEVVKYAQNRIENKI